MKKIIILNITKKKLIAITTTFLAFIICFIASKTQAMTHYQKVDFSTGLVTATTLNVRQGPSTSYKVVTQVYKNEYIRVFAKVGTWYIIQTDKDYIGAVSAKYIRAIYPSTGNAGTSDNSQNTTTTVLSEDEKEVFNLINKKRAENGLSALKIDDEVVNVARIKAKDLVQNNYFAHESPTYGTPFQMLKNFGIFYKTAGENIAGNSSNKKAVEAWMNSSGHRANILNSNYNYTGIGVVTSSKYGKVYVQMFIGK